MSTLLLSLLVVAASATSWEFQLNTTFSGTPGVGLLLTRPNSTAPWGTVCGSSLSTDTVAILCTTFGFPTYIGSVLQHYQGGSLGMPTYLSWIQCNKGSTLQQCTINEDMSLTTCQQHKNDIGLDCRALVGRVVVPDGSDPQSGRLELMVSSIPGVWGTVAAIGFTDAAALAACHSAGFTNISSAYSVPSFTSPNATLPIYLSNLQCPGGVADMTLEDCSYWYYRTKDNFPAYAHIAGVDCSGAARPAEPVISYSATVDSSVSASTFADRVANTAQCGSDRVIVMGSHSNGTAGFSVFEFRFTDNTTNTVQTRWYLDDVLQSKDSNAIKYNLVAYKLVSNLTAAVLPTMEFRLVGGAVNSTGRVEVRPDAASPWGTICTDGFGFSQLAAVAVCHSLGFTARSATFAKESTDTFGNGNGFPYLRNVQCAGDNYYLQNCSMRYVPPLSKFWNGCTNNYDQTRDAVVAVDCSPPMWEFDLNSTATGTPGVGLVLARPNSTAPWGTVCGHNFRGDEYTISLLCVALGFATTTGAVVTGYQSGRGRLMYLSSIYCHFSVPYIEMCAFYRASSSESCENDAFGLDCTGKFQSDTTMAPNGVTTVMPTSAPSAAVTVAPSMTTVAPISSGTSTVSPNAASPSARLWEFQLNTTVSGTPGVGLLLTRPNSTALWGTVCGSSLSTDTVAILCTTFGFPTYIGSVLQHYQGASVGTPTYLSWINCNKGSTLQQCGFNEDASLSTCQEHVSDIGLDCRALVGRVVAPDASNPQRGRLELMVSSNPGVWGTIASYGFADSAALAACHSAGFANISTAYSIPSFASANMTLPIYLSNVQCPSGVADMTLEDCSYSYYPAYTFSGSSHVVGVDCSGSPRPEEPMIGYSATVDSSVSVSTFAYRVANSYPVQSSSDRVMVMNSYSNGTAGFSVFEFRFTDNTTNTVQTRWNLDNAVLSTFPEYIKSYFTVYNLVNNLTAAVLPTMEFRLVGGAVNSTGRVEVRPDAESPWGTICTDGFGFSQLAAVAVCHSLGFTGRAAMVAKVVTNTFGTGDGFPYLRNVQCVTGNYYLQNCSLRYVPSSSMYWNGCPNADAAVDCSPPVWDFALNSTLTGTPGVGLLMVRPNSSAPWGTACLTSMSPQVISLFCASVGFPTSTSLVLQNYEGGRGMPLYVTSINNCNSLIPTIDSCSFRLEWYDSCGSQRFGVDCTGKFQWQANTPTPIPTQSPAPQSTNNPVLTESDCTASRVNDEVDAMYSNITGANTIPMNSTILTQSRVLADRNISYHQPRCMQYLCLNASSMMFRAGNAFYGCQGQYPALSELTFMLNHATNSTNSALSVSAIPAYGYYGQIQCPNASVVCANGSTFAGLGVTGFPKLLAVSPSRASVAGNVTLNVTYDVGSTVVDNVTCKGVLIGGQQTDVSTWVPGDFRRRSAGVFGLSFVVNTLPLSSTAHGGANSDGSGVVDVSLLCMVPGVVECGTQYGGYCAVNTLRQAFMLEPLPVASPPPVVAVTASIVSTLSSTAPHPYDVTVDGDGAVLYVSYIFSAVYRLAANGTAMLVAGIGYDSGGYAEGVGSAAKFNRPWGITYDAVSNIAYISDRLNCRIRQLDLATKNVTTLAGMGIIGFQDGVGTNAQFCDAYGIVHHASGVLYVTDNQFVYGSNHASLRRINVTSAFFFRIRSVTDGPGLNATFFNPWGAKWHCVVRVQSTVCGVLVADNSHDAVRFVAIEGLPTATAALSPTHTASSTASSTSSISASFSDSNELWGGTRVAEYWSFAQNSPTIAQCRAACAQRKGGFPATIASAAENTLVQNTIPVGWGQALIGGNRLTGDGNNFRWTEGPLGRENGGLGRLFWNGKTTSGTCASGAFCNWLPPTEPNNADNNEPMVNMFQTDGKWYDNAPGASAPKGCACKRFVITETVSQSMSPTWYYWYRAASTPTLTQCRGYCAQQPGGFLAVIMSASENA
ncbi:Hypothetical protein, putative, partial [Bodo saltans]